MAGIKISQLPVIPSCQLTDLIAEVQPASGGTTYQTTLSQLATLFNANLTFLPLAGGTMSGAINMGTFGINNMANPVNAQDAATKSYVDNIATGGGAPVYAATTANLNATYSNGVAGVGATLTNAGSLAAFSVDGQSPSSGARILVKNQSTNTQNGVYTLTTVGSGAVAWVLTRATDYDTPANINNTGVIPVENGTTNAGTGWYNSTIMVTVGTTAVTFVQFGAVIPTTSTAGLALLSTGTGNGTVWSTVQYPATLTANSIAYAGVSNVMTGLATANSATLRTLSTGAPIMAVPNIAVSSSCGTFSGAGSSGAITNLSVTLTTLGRPVLLMLADDGTGSGSAMFMSASGTGSVVFKQGASSLTSQILNNTTYLPVSSFSYIYTPTAGTYTWTANYTNATNNFNLSNAVLIAYEL